MPETMSFKKNTTFLGRNGEFKCSGLSVASFSDYVLIEPITSKGEVGRCSIRIPVESIGGLCRLLKEAKGV